MKKKLLVLISLIMILAGSFAFAGTQLVSAETDDTPPVSVTPTAVIFTDPTCGNSGYFTVPTIEGVVYKTEKPHRGVVTGVNNVAAGVTVVVEAHARQGYTINEGVQKEWRWTFKTQDCLIDPAGSVVFTAPTCSQSGYYTLADITGIIYHVGNAVVAPGKYTVQTGTTVTITATADNGYFLTPGVPSAWTYTFTALNNCVTTVASTTKPTTLPLTSGDPTIANVTMLSAISAVIAVIGVGARSLLVKRF